MRIILGCPKTVKLEVLRAELGFPSIISRIHELACRSVCRMICNGNRNIQNVLARIHDNPRASVRPYLRRLYNVLTRFNVIDPCLELVSNPCYPTWQPHRPSIDIECLAMPKGSWLPHVLKAHFMSKLSTYSQHEAIHVFCDGSVNGSKSGCGLFIRDYSSPTEYTDTEVSKRLPDNLSSTRAKLYAILEALRITVALRKHVYLFVDNQSALYAFKSTSPTDCDLVNHCLRILSVFKDNGLRALFTWVPSHVGIPKNERADRLARDAIHDTPPHPGAEFTYNYIKNSLRSYICSMF